MAQLKGISRKTRNIFIEAGIITASLLALTLIIITLNADIHVQNFFYDPDLGWHMGDMLVFRILYRYGEKPAWALVFISAFCLIAGSVPDVWDKMSAQRLSTRLADLLKSLETRRRSFVLVILLMILGPGLIVNTALKDHLGRPRPREITQFGGEHEFVHPWARGTTGRNSSFPSGHSSVAFFLFAPFFILSRNKVFLRRLFLGLGVVFGLVMGTARIAQGGHFLSDVIWAGGLVFLTGFFLRYALKLDEKGYLF